MRLQNNKYLWFKKKVNKISRNLKKNDKVKFLKNK